MLVKNTIFTKTKTYPVYFRTPEFIYELARYSGLSSTAKRVYGVIYSRIMQSEESVGSVSNAKKALKKAGLIECEDIREGFKCITKFYLTDLNTLGIPAHLLYYGTAGNT